jgi:hypothetical protein
MKHALLRTSISAVLILGLNAGAFAQSDKASGTALAGPAPALPSDGPASNADAPAGAVVDPDNMADSLNSRQQIRQSFTFTRTKNGEVIETKQETVTYSRSDPVLTTEAQLSPFDALKQRFDNEVLTRTEALEEARLDFVIADLDRDGRLTESEFLRLVATWRDRSGDGDAAESARERQYRSFIEQLENETPVSDADAARTRYLTLAGSAPSISREDYVRDYLVDFDAMDADGDMMLRGDELIRFRALNRGRELSK